MISTCLLLESALLKYAYQDPKSPTAALNKRIRSMLTKIDTQLSEYDARVGNSLQMISCDPQGRIPVYDLKKALAVIKHKPNEEVGHAVIQKLDVDKDGFVELEHVLGLVREEGLGTLHRPFNLITMLSTTDSQVSCLMTMPRTSLAKDMKSRATSRGKRISCRSRIALPYSRS